MATLDDRYAHILKQLAKKASAPTKQALMRVLDDLNVWQTLEMTRDNAPDGIYAYGPRSINHIIADKSCCGAVIWYKLGGFYGYKSLSLLGVWVVQSDEIDVIVGGRQLTYSAPIYNPESYHRIIRRDYRPYYTYDNAPPSDGRAVTLTYMPQQRLKLRKQIADLLLASIR